MSRFQLSLDMIKLSEIIFSVFLECVFCSISDIWYHMIDTIRFIQCLLSLRWLVGSGNIHSTKFKSGYTFTRQITFVIYRFVSEWPSNLMNGHPLVYWFNVRGHVNHEESFWIYIYIYFCSKNDILKRCTHVVTQLIVGLVLYIL